MQHAPATIHVFTFKDGLLARLAHDLRLTLRRFELRRDGQTVTGRFWPESLTVDGAVKSGHVDPSSLSDGDKAKIHANMTDEILHTARDPEVSFKGTLRGTSTIEGELTLAGRTCPISATIHNQDGRLRTEVTLVPSRWGIPPYKALAGAIKLQDRVLVALDLPSDPTGGGQLVPDPCTWAP